MSFTTVVFMCVKMEETDDMDKLTDARTLHPY